MKSTTSFKKTFIYSILLLLILVILPINLAMAGYGLRLKDAHLTFYMEIDDNRIVKFIGLPLEGDYFFDLKKASLIFSPKYTKTAYRVNVAPLEEGMPKARFSRDGSRDGKMYLGYDTQHWRLTTKDKDCKEVYSSKKLGAKINLTMTDIARINIVFAYITGKELTEPCSSHVVSKAAGMLIGMPLHSYSMLDRSDFEVKTIKDDKNLKAHILPDKIIDFNKKAYAKYLNTLLTKSSYMSFLQTIDILGGGMVLEIRALKQLLKNPRNRRKILPDSSVGSGATSD